MAMYPEDDNEKKNENDWKRIQIKCFECGKYCGYYFREKPTFFVELFFCSFKCRQVNLDKEEEKEKLKGKP